jgi:hypothetical protein
LFFCASAQSQVAALQQASKHWKAVDQTNESPPTVCWQQFLQAGHHDDHSVFGLSFDLLQTEAQQTAVTTSL